MKASSTVQARHTGRGLVAARLISALCMMLCVCAAASALDARLALDQLHHTRWTARDGAPSNIAALAQTADGYLWLGTATGLFRFDGVRFERFEPFDGPGFPSESIASLRALPEGGLWIGYRYGGTSLLRDGRLRHYGSAQGLAVDLRVWALELDRRGRLWAGTSGGLYRFDGERWNRIGAEQGFSGRDVYAVLADRGGTLWAASAQGLYSLAEDAAQFQRSSQPASTAGALAQAADGNIWSADRLYGLRRLTGSGGDGAWRWSEDNSELLFDRDGALWIDAQPVLRRLRHPERLPPPREGEPLPETEAIGDISGLPLSSMLEDREGNVWLGSINGLDRFRNNALVRVAANSGGLAPTGAGGIWLASHDGMLYRLGPAERRLRDGLKVGRKPVTRVMRDDQGRLWIGTLEAGQLWRADDLSGSSFSAMPMPPGIDAGAWTSGIARERGGALWAAFSRTPTSVYRYADGRWTERGGHAELPEATARCMLADAQGRIWIGYEGSRLGLVENGKARVFAEADGLRLGSVIGLHVHGDRVWVGGETGVALLGAQGVAALRGAGGEVFRGVSGLVQTRDGELWLNGTDGITRIRREEVDRFVADPAHAVAFRRFDFRDGLDESAIQFAPLPSLVEDDGGRLWFATNLSLLSVDPRALEHNPLPPPVQVRSLGADGRSWAPSPQPLLPAGVSSVQIDYTALSLTIPERVRFRYRLEGVDAHWQDAGTRRQAFYTNLRPGHYRFRVLAANNDGVWNETGDSLDFSLAPAFWQTGWFLLLCAALVLCLLWLAYLLRMRQLRAQLQAQLSERMRERERIARELHDTLLQSIQGLSLRFHALVQRLPAEEPVRPAMEQALDRADNVVAEGRDRVLRLRDSARGADDLAQALDTVGRELAAADGDTRFELYSEGKPRSLAPFVQDEVFQIAREAVCNAFRHAGAQGIAVRIRYRAEALQVVVEDDGGGMPPQVLELGRKPGHWGLAGMRERAQSIGALLEIGSRDGQGTRVDLTVPAAVAYRGARRGWLPAWLRRAAGR